MQSERLPRRGSLLLVSRILKSVIAAFGAVPKEPNTPDLTNITEYTLNYCGTRLVLRYIPKLMALGSLGFGLAKRCLQQIKKRDMGPHRTTIWVVDPAPSPVSLRQSYFAKLARNAVSVGTIRVTIRLLWGCYKITMGTVRILRALHSHKITCHAFDGSWWHEKASSFVTYM